VDPDLVRDRLARLGAESDPGPDRGPPIVTDDGPGRHAARPIGSGARLQAELADRVPARLRGAMDGGFSGHHLGVLAVVLAVGLAITAWWVLSGRPEGQPVPSASFSPSSSPSIDETVSTSPSAGTGWVSPGEVVIVDVAGKVRHPGIVTLPVGSRVVDALEAAGGARAGVDLADLNLARVLVDGEQLLVGLAPAASWAPTGSTAGPSVAAGLVNINTADQATLETLPGVGPVTAQAILDWRTENGAFTSVDELLEVDGIGEVTLAELRDLVTV
jgi:competence protein ComEA